ncbi:DUF2971 domain-containing protein [Burkholderia pseudomallei]|uniref:DUF2971 domain-containing protein n=2 Tax=Burkholderia pseudomallei TaxID=28450 RepID=UPI00035B9E1A|nr:DUF2971 domain-containing protein [Burkholderia pseudomallei]AGR69657.1 hypothetical protein BDL_5502 [Burkholderia pseudomallei MSHR305]AHK67756.1 hypothetical protein BBX_4668 [Burkholderia pseudomallei MSHR520]AIP83243.1 hypothetical protein JE55_3988 [Burkholderia pseudomallei]KGU58456.1 hypothetical protein Y037_4114 [Burkholderia pseudomallei MSHR983]KGW58232.1 hypothetical protein Y029_5734 [Burkholderia pseudomallei MSHR303]
MNDQNVRSAEAANLLSESEPVSDYRCFKFRAINKYLIESLVNSHLYFAKPAQLNDPFDCQLDLRRSFARAASSMPPGERRRFLELALNHGDKFLEQWKRNFENFGICSFSLELTAENGSSLMWSHYADQHRGICLLYRFPASFLENPDNRIFGVDTVKYYDDGMTNWLKNDAPLEMESFIKSLAKIYLTVKGPAWKYEREARLIRSECGLLHIPCGYLEQICFGLGTSSADIDLVRKLASQYCGCTDFCQIIRAESDFGISAEAL